MYEGPFSPIRRPSMTKNARQPPSWASRPASTTDSCSRCLRSLNAVNTGLSCMERRRKIAKKAMKIEIKKGIRQPHVMSCSFGMVKTSSQTEEARSVPVLEPTPMSEATTPRCLTGENSASMTAPPESSAPAPNPWQRRKNTSNAGASQPTWRYVGSKPSAVVETPMSPTVITMMTLRPWRSPTRPKIMAPSGRARKPTA